MSSQSSELAATRAELEAERSAKLHKLTHLEASNEQLRLGQGSFQQKLALKEQALEREREVAQEMRRRMQHASTTYLTAGQWLDGQGALPPHLQPGLPGLAPCAACCCAPGGCR
jgi:hypothetical protein